ncbi:xylulokinase [Microbacterium sp. KHB019]|uniref:xylulokinase n=1 Tax=Microbacterium sp. KHB019 TaxID=3129770 RepID=UPI0030799049
MPAVLAIDIGSSAVRAAVVLPRRIVAQQTVRRGGAGSGLRFDPLALWDDVCRAVAALPERHRRDLGAVGIAGHVGAVIVDDVLAPIGAAYGWANPEGVEELRGALGDEQDAVLRETGRPTLGGGPIATLLSLRRRSPGEYARVAHVLSPKDYVLARMGGAVVTDHTSAAYYGASSVRDRAWSPGILARLGLPEQLLPVQHASADVVGAVTTDAAHRLGVAPGLPLVAGGPDGTIGAMAVAGTRRDAIVDVAGTTDVLVRVVAEAPTPGGPELKNPYALDGLWTTGGSTGMTGGAVSWWAHALGLGSAAQALDALRGEMEHTGPGADGVRMLPWMSGSRYPRWRPDARGGLSGLRGEHGPAHVFRAVLEGVAFSVRQGIDSAAHDDGMPVLLAGGAARSPWLVQLRADILGRPVTAMREPDVSLVGAGLIALVATGELDRDEVVWSESEDMDEVVPSRDSAAYDEVYSEWLDAASAADG